jgi:hypothetical protein
MLLDVEGNNIGDEGTRALVVALANNATLTTLDLDYNNIGAQGADVLAAALDNNATPTTLWLGNINVGAESVRALAPAPSSGSNQNDELRKKLSKSLHTSA